MNIKTQLSPLRNTTKFEKTHDLAVEQAEHFGIDVESNYGKALIALAETLYQANLKTHDLWSLTIDGLSQLDRSDRIAWFNAKRFVSFQLAKILDNMQNPLRATCLAEMILFSPRVTFTVEHINFLTTGTKRNQIWILNLNGSMVIRPKSLLCIWTTLNQNMLTISVQAEIFLSISKAPVIRMAMCSM